MSSSDSETVSSSAYDVSHCSFCKKNLSSWTLTRRQQHIDRCSSENCKSINSQQMQCPLCFKLVKNSSGKVQHMKACAKKRGVSTEALLQLASRDITKVQVLLQHSSVSTPSNSAHEGTFDSLFLESSAATSKVKLLSKSAKAEPTLKSLINKALDEDLQTALALSRSLREAEKAEEKRLEEQTSTAQRMNFSADEREKRTTKRFSQLIFSASSGRCVENHVSMRAATSSVEDTDVSSNMWSLSAQTLLSQESYYVAALQPPISPCRVASGDKLLHISQIPGREHSFYEASVEHLTQIGAACAQVDCADGLPTELDCQPLPSLAVSFSKMLGSAVLADLRVWPADSRPHAQPILAHKFILAARAPWLLQRLRDGDNLDAATADHDTVMQMLHLLYCGIPAHDADLVEPHPSTQLLHLARQWSIVLPSDPSRHESLETNLTPWMECSVRADEHSGTSAAKEMLHSPDLFENSARSVLLSHSACEYLTDDGDYVEPLAKRLSIRSNSLTCVPSPAAAAAVLQCHELQTFSQPDASILASVDVNQWSDSDFAMSQQPLAVELDAAETETLEGSFTGQSPSRRMSRAPAPISSYFKFKSFKAAQCSETGAGPVTDNWQAQNNLTPTQRKRKCKRKWLAPSPFTPQPKYSCMATPDLHMALKRYGVRCLPKKKAILLLNEIYKETHCYENDPEFSVTTIAD